MRQEASRAPYVAWGLCALADHFSFIVCLNTRIYFHNFDRLKVAIDNGWKSGPVDNHIQFLLFSIISLADSSLCFVPLEFILGDQGAACCLEEDRYRQRSSSG
jgi:hypothetical protein